MKLSRSWGKILLVVFGCLLATMAIASVRKAHVKEATLNAMRGPGMAKTLPHFLKEELEDRQEARERDRKFLSHTRQRATPSLANHEGPRSLAEEKLASRAFPGTSLPLDGAAIGGYDKQVGALAFIPMRPVAIEKMLGDVGLHFVLFFFGVALAVAIIVFAVRIHRRSKGDGFAVRGPFHEIRAC